MRIGNGYDVHPLIPGRKLILGGITIPFDKGLDGWSDADVLTHAVMDALLGAAALQDIGYHFPPGQDEYKGASSLDLLKKVVQRLGEKGYRAGNIDVTVVAERPRLREYVDQIRGSLAKTIGIDVGKVSVKASTSNGLGFIGSGQGIAAYAVALIEEK